MYLINFKLNQIKPFIVKYCFLLLLLPFLGCSDFQKVLKADDLFLKNEDVHIFNEIGERINEKRRRKK